MEGESMSEWKELRAQDFCFYVTDGTHDSPKKRTKGYYLLTSKHIGKDTLDFESAYKISEDDYLKIIERSKVEQYDILYSMIGTIGNVHIVKENKVDFAVKNMGIFKFNGNYLHSLWMYYWLKSTKATEYIKSRLSGSTQQYITLSSLRDFPISIPEIDIMRLITGILSSLDAKIETNNKLNEKLEEMAQAIFKSWFVDFEPFKDKPFHETELGMIPEGWEVTTIGEQFKTLLGGTPSRNREEYWNGNIAWINSGEINKFRILNASEYITEEGLKNSATKLLPSKTTVLAITGATLGQVSLLEIDTCANQSVIGVLESDVIKYQFIYPLINTKIKYLILHQTGGAQQHINKQNVDGMKFVMPPRCILMKYQKITQDIFNIISTLSFENDRLASLRDTLLPRLMSGELTV